MLNTRAVFEISGLVYCDTLSIALVIWPSAFALSLGMVMETLMVEDGRLRLVKIFNLGSMPVWVLDPEDFFLKIKYGPVSISCDTLFSTYSEHCNLYCRSALVAHVCEADVKSLAGRCITALASLDGLEWSSLALSPSCDLPVDSTSYLLTPLQPAPCVDFKATIQSLRQT